MRKNDIEWGYIIYVFDWSQHLLNLWEFIVVFISSIVPVGENECKERSAAQIC